MENTMCGARADFQTAGLNGVFAHFCRRGQKWVAPERETSPCRLLKEMGPPEAGKGSAPRLRARNGPCAAGGKKESAPRPRARNGHFVPANHKKRAASRLSAKQLSAAPRRPPPHL